MEFPNPYGKSIKLFDVSYEVPPAPSEQQQTGAETKPLTINERRVKPDRIRLLANEDGEAVLDDGSLVSTLLEQIARSSGSGGPSRNIYRAENPNINKDTGRLQVLLVLQEIDLLRQGLESGRQWLCG